MKKKFLLGGIVTICSSLLFAQQDKMENDRPGESITPELTAKGYVQFEVGFEKEQHNPKDYSLLHPEAVIKYGISRKAEVRMQLNSKTEKFFSVKEFNYGLEPVQFGIKTSLNEEKGIIPHTSVLGMLGIPTFASKDHRADHIIPKLRLLFENSVRKKIKLNYNIGAEWDGITTNPDWLYSITPQFELTEKMGVFLEEYGVFHKGEKPIHYFDAGFDYGFTSNLKFDVYAGVGLTEESSDYFISSGISFRFGR